MPYKRRYTKRSRLSPGRKFGNNVGDVARAAYNGVVAIKKLINVEHHKHDTNVTGSQISNTGAIFSLTDVAQGDGQGERSGDSILCQSMFSRTTVTISPSAVTTCLRYIIFQDKQQISDSEPAVTDVLQTASCLSPLNEITVGRFKILHDTLYTVQDNGVAIRFTKMFKELNTHVRFNGSAGSDHQKNTIYLLALSDQATNKPILASHIRLNYTDN